MVKTFKEKKIREFLELIKEEVGIIAMRNGIIFPNGCELINKKINELAEEKLW